MSRPSVLLLIAWLLAVSATGSALFIGEVMGMAPCVLCWYQRIAMFPLALLLGMAFYSDDRRGAVYALPLALAGAVVIAAADASSEKMVVNVNLPDDDRCNHVVRYCKSLSMLGGTFRPPARAFPDGCRPS